MAQDDGGLRIGLGVSQTFAYGDNLALGVPNSVQNPEQGKTSQAQTAFALNIDSSTRIERFNLQLGGALSFSDLPVGSTTETGFIDPFVSLGYSRTAANATFTFNGSYVESDISRPRPLWDFANDDNLIVPPSDLSSLQGTGLRKATDFDTELELGLNSPIGLRLSASSEKVEYENATNNNLNDFERFQAGASLLFRFNPVTTAVLDLGVSRFNESGVANDRDTQRAEVGLDRTFSDQSRLSVRVGYTDGDSNNVGRPSDARGSTGSVDYQRPLTNGSLGARYAVTRDSTGEIDRFNVNRNYDLPLGSLGVSVGATSVYGASPRLTGGVNWSQQRQASLYSLNFSRRVLPDENDNNRFTTTVAARYSHELSPVSTFVANASYFLSDGGTTTNQVDRANIVLRYDYALTDDWNLNAGVNLRMRDEENVGRGESQEVFFGISRRFDLYR